MKRIILSSAFLFIVLFAFAQPTQLDVNFDDGSVAFVPIHAIDGDPSYVLSVVDGILNIETHKKEALNDWSFLGLWGQPVSLTALKTVQFSVKTDIDGVNFKLTLKSPSVTDAEVKTDINFTQTLSVGDGSFTYYYFEVGDLVDANAEFQPALIDEIQLEVSNGWNIATDGLVELDYIRFGYAEPLPSGGSAYTETFDTGLPVGVSGDSKHAVTGTDGAMQVNVSRSDRWQALDYNLGAAYDFSSNPIVNLDLKTEQPAVFQLFLVDEGGNGFASEWIESQYTYYELVSGEYEFRQARIYPDTSFSSICFDFSDADAGIVDLSKIIQLKLCINGTALTFNGTYQIDEIRIGDDAVKSGYIGQIEDKDISRFADPSQTILIPEILNITSIAMSGGDGLISNTSVDPITYVDRVENGLSVRYGYTKLYFDLIADASGSSLITLTGTGTGDYGDFTETFTLNINENGDPSMEQPDSIVVKVGEETAIKLSKISDGDPEINQELILTATSDNLSVADNIAIAYTQDFLSADLTFTALSAGTANCEVKIEDEDGASTTVSFKIDAFDDLNMLPTIDQIGDIPVLNNSGENTITLSGISDGDEGSQILTITAESSAAAIIPDPVISYTAGENTAVLAFTPVEGQAGSSIITVRVADDGGDASNDGDKYIEMSFTINSLNQGVTGYIVDMEDPDVLADFGPSGTYDLSIVDKDGGKVMKIVMTDKGTWDGIFLTLPELDLSQHPLVSYEVYSEDVLSYHWNYFYEVHGRDGSINRNIQNSNDHKYEAPAGVWTTVSFDYREEGDMNNSEGNAIDASRIDGCLINMHNNLQGWPFTEFSGTVYYRNMRFGDQADVPAPTYNCTIDEVPGISVFEGTETVDIVLTGISNGKGETAGVTLSSSSSNESVAGSIVIGDISESGEATVTITTAELGYTNITITATAEGSESVSEIFFIKVIEPVPTEFATVAVDANDKNQVIRGLGTFSNEQRWSELYASDLGASAMRLGLIGNQWEPVNDNDNPDELNMEAFNYGAFDWDYYRGLKDMGVEAFIITSWSPPAWMKRNMSLDHKGQAVNWELTDNILDPVYYEEFAEMWVGLIKAFKELCDIDITAIGLQNEPFFNEPYGSAILGPDQFPDLIEMVGNRLAAEGLGHVGFYMPEQVFGFFAYSPEQYHSKLILNPVADSYTPYFAVHGYDQTGIDSDFPNYDKWRELYNSVSSGDYPKELWMSETHIGYEGWNSALSLAGALHGSLWAGNITLWTNWSFGDMQLTRNEPNSSFYVSKNFFKYIRPGAVRIETTMDHPDLLASAYINEDGSYVMVMVNKSTGNILTGIQGDIPDSYDLYRTSSSEDCVDAGEFKLADGVLILPGSSVTTFVSNKAQLLTMNQPLNVHMRNDEGETQLVIDGISNGAGGVDNLALEFTNSNESLFSNISLSDINSEGEAILTFTPIMEVDGFTKITLSLSDDAENTYTVAFYITVEMWEDVDEKIVDQFRIYPNPSTAFLHIELPDVDITSLDVLDITGKICHSEQFSSNSIILNTSTLTNGVYLLRISGEKGSLVKMFVKE